MKFISFIFALYFLSLTLAPCGDELFIDNCGIETTCSDIENSQHSDSDTCNPLCMCSCCGGVTILTNSVNNLNTQVPSGQLFIYTQNSLSENSFSIWQPPKIG